MKKLENRFVSAGIAALEQCSRRDRMRIGDKALRERMRSHLHNIVKHVQNDLEQRRFDSFLVLFDGHERLNGFVAIEGGLTDAEYWTHLGEVWQGAEVIHIDLGIWRRLLRSGRAERHLMMSPEEQAALAALPAELDLFRGFTHRGGENSLSWTLDEERAKFFADFANSERRQFLVFAKEGEPKVARGRCKKGDVLAYFNRRKECEIVIEPDKVESKCINPAKP